MYPLILFYELVKMSVVLSHHTNSFPSQDLSKALSTHFVYENLLSIRVEIDDNGLIIAMFFVSCLS